MIEYTISSHDEDNYSHISENLDGPLTRQARLTVTGLTTKCTIVVLEDGDYIEINNHKYIIRNDYTSLDHSNIVYILSQLLTDIDIEVSLDECSRLIFTSIHEFTINDASYNIRMLTGLYATDVFPISSLNNIIRANSVGLTLSTPVLYLTSNIGTKAYRNKDNIMTNSKILVRLNNSYSPNYPIIVTNGDFTTTCNSNDLSSIEFDLVDANMRKIKLLSPMYLLISIMAIPDEQPSLTN